MRPYVPREHLAHFFCTLSCPLFIYVYSHCKVLFQLRVMWYSWQRLCNMVQLATAV